MSSDLMEFAEEGIDPELLPGTSNWTVLMVDDDRDVHDATLMSLQGLQIEGRELHFLHAYSSAEARRLLIDHMDVAVILLDVVMETEDAGLRLVQDVRNDMELANLQIILRTGQPGFAPEIETIQKYAINDYRTKTELTKVRLYTSLTGAIRTYQHLEEMEETRRSLEVVVHSSTEISRVNNLQDFCEKLLSGLCTLMRMQRSGIVCVLHERQIVEEASVVVAAGAHAQSAGQALGSIDDASVRDAIGRCFKVRANSIGATTALYFTALQGVALVVFVDAQPLRAMDQALIQALCSSMTVALENVLLQERMFSLAYKDQLLGLANRNRFLELLQPHLGQTVDITVAVIDLDDFAGDNAMFGHEFGDELLKAFAVRLAQCLGPKVGLARLSGDTFALVGSGDLVNSQALANCTAAALKVQSQFVTVAATSGMVRLDAQSISGAEVLKQAHVALKVAKSQHRGDSLYYSEAMGTDATERSTLLRRLREAFESDRLFVVYQPQVRLADGATVGAEALLRWRNDEGKYVPPDQFIPVAEQSGLMISIGEFVLRSACFELKQLNQAGFYDFRMSVNVSQAQFREAGFISTVTRALADSGVMAERLELEITESMAAEEIEFVLTVLHELKKIGVTIAIDDFGTGYSSLSILSRLPLDRLKIDKSFVGDLDATEGVAKSIIDIGRSLKLELIAEGVETARQVSQLVSLGCQEGQGYLFARPLSPDDLINWLDSR
jgi:diguanylate cyclase (GGDEF)-like protein